MTKAIDEKFCADCGQTIKARAEICPHCGVRQQAAPSTFSATAPNGKSKIAAALFAFFLGGIGARKFYLGQVGKGFLYASPLQTAQDLSLTNALCAYRVSAMSFTNNFSDNHNDNND